MEVGRVEVYAEKDENVIHITCTCNEHSFRMAFTVRLIKQHARVPLLFPSLDKKKTHTKVDKSVISFFYVNLIIHILYFFFFGFKSRKIKYFQLQYISKSAEHFVMECNIFFWS